MQAHPLPCTEPSSNRVSWSPLFVPQAERPMKVAVFASGGGGNLRAAIRAGKDSSQLLSIDLVITDRPDIPAIDIARNAGIPVIIGRFEEECGSWATARKSPLATHEYRRLSKEYHDRILEKIIEHEKANGKIDFAVLSYRRWISGDLLQYFKDRMINQHAGDLAQMAPNGTRLLVGIDPVSAALRMGFTKTRTSTFLVNEGHDSGEILCQGPWVPFIGNEVTRNSALAHEIRQKQESDWPSLTFALTGIAQGYFGVCANACHNDGTRVVTFKGNPLPYEGFSINSQC